MSEPFVAETWLYTTLAGDAALMGLATGVYADVAPEGAVFPFVVFTYQAGRDVATLNGNRIHTWATYQVKAITDQPSYGAVRTIADRIDALLHRATGTAADGTIFSCVREEPVRFTESASGKQYRHLGGLYRLQVQSVPAAEPPPEIY